MRKVQTAAGRPLASEAKLRLARLHAEVGVRIQRLLAEQLRLEQELAVLVEDVYGLTAEERDLLSATRPVRDPIDVLLKMLAGHEVETEPEARIAEAEE
jgi:hypothetical protein